MICAEVRELRSPSCDPEELLVSESEEVEEVVSVVEDKGEEAGGGTCCAKTEPHRAKRTTSLVERLINRVVRRIVIINQQSNPSCIGAKLPAGVSSVRPRSGSGTPPQHGSGSERGQSVAGRLRFEFASTDRHRPLCVGSVEAAATAVASCVWSVSTSHGCLAAPLAGGDIVSCRESPPEPTLLRTARPKA